MNKSEENVNPQDLNSTIIEAIEEEAIEDIPAVAARESANELSAATTSELRFNAERVELEIKRLGHENEALKDVHELRKEYIPKLFWLTVGWLVFVVMTVWRVAGAREFYLSDSVLMALITSTTVNVIGIFVIAARWLFPHKK